MKLPNTLFWDIDPLTLDYDLHARFIIQRVIQRGSIEDWKIIKKHYGIDIIKKEILKMRSLDVKSLSFFNTIFGVKKEKFRCYTMPQSMPEHYNY